MIAALLNLGGGFTLAGVILLLHREALKAFREEMATERARHDQHLTQVFNRLDGMKEAFQQSRCRGEYPSTHKPT